MRERNCEGLTQEKSGLLHHIDEVWWDVKPSSIMHRLNTTQGCMRKVSFRFGQQISCFLVKLQSWDRHGMLSPEIPYQSWLGSSRNVCFFPLSSLPLFLFFLFLFFFLNWSYFSWISLICNWKDRIKGPIDKHNQKVLWLNIWNVVVTILVIGNIHWDLLDAQHYS